MMRWQPVLSAVAGVLLLASAQAKAAASVPAQLRPPAGQKLLFEAHAEGVQIYVSTAEPGSAPKWVLEAPLARLTVRQGKLVIHHYAGPSWEAGDGSKDVRDKDEKVVSIAAPRPEADIPWLLVRVNADPAAGILDKVAYVQRISTKGGVAPSTPPVRPDTRIGVPYSATYVFYGTAD